MLAPFLIAWFHESIVLFHSVVFNLNLPELLKRRRELDANLWKNPDSEKTSLILPESPMYLFELFLNFKWYIYLFSYF